MADRDMIYSSRSADGEFFIASIAGALDIGALPVSQNSRIYYVSATEGQEKFVHLSTDLTRVVGSERGRTAVARTAPFYRIFAIDDKIALNKRNYHTKYMTDSCKDEVVCLFKLLDNIVDNVLDTCLVREQIDDNTAALVDSVLKMFVLDSISHLLHFHERQDTRQKFVGMPAKHIFNIVKEIEENYADPDLSPKKVARNLSITVRYVHALLHQSGRSFSERLQERRLTSAYRMLNSDYFCTKNIGNIAYRVGFSDQSHFNRCFKKRFGVAPGQIRKQSQVKVAQSAPAASHGASARSIPHCRYA
jgi:AraC-like DNA-binding protein